MTGLERARTYVGYLNQSDTMGLHVKNDNYDYYTHKANITAVLWEPAVNVIANADDHKLHRLSSPREGYGYAAADHKLHRPKAVYSDDKGGVPHTNHERHVLDPYGTQRTVIPQIFRDDEYRKSLVTLSANRTMRNIIDEYDMERPLHYL
ncbi:sialidase-like [Pyrus ussuriensis x Pyrus communis]|uniref:Sialidase-like n=1 Tax=Pyrus ussuriensis x Pyrus communis TaxID=2448454 RepID=A0A5N5HTJ7_9ROSA|nr:sialidase-like [Pyrus ussuriensis x Pyrus communis]